MANNLRALRESRDWSQDQAATALGTTRNQYAKLEGGSRRLSDVWISPGRGGLRGRRRRRGDGPQGRGAGRGLRGGRVRGAFRHGAGPMGEASAPEGSTLQTVAVEVRGDSLGTFFDGWLVFYDDVRSPITDDLLGRLCVVGLEDGRVLVKMVHKNRSGRFDLHGQFGEPVLDIEVLWAARVTSMMPG